MYKTNSLAGPAASLAPGTMTKTLERAASDACKASVLAVAPPPRLRSGFAALDRVLNGGFRPSDLVVVGGAPGVGKTIAALQMARAAALEGRSALYVSFEHDDATLLGRLLALEVAELGVDRAEADRLALVAVEAAAGFRPLQRALDDEPLLFRAYSRLGVYAQKLVLANGSGNTTDLAELDALVARHLEPGGLLVLDYLQRVVSDHDDEDKHVTMVTGGLKDVAMRHQVVVLALVAADWDGLRSGRLRLHHLRGSTALAYECDVAVLLNDKHAAVAKEHIAYDARKAEAFRREVVFSVEKNRGGPADLHLDFRKDFLHYRFDPQGAVTQERLVDDRLAGE